MNPPPRVDVLVPVHDGEATIRAAIRSLQDQTYQDLRILVVDDGSTDGTPGILAEMAAADPRLHVIRQRNGGIVDARNAGLGAATGEFLAQQDADDLSDPDRIRKQVTFLDAHPGHVAVSGAARHIDGGGRPTGHVAHHPPPGEADPAWAPSREPHLAQPFLMVRRLAMERVGGYRHVLLAEDGDLYWRLRNVGGLHNLDDVLGSYRVHEGSVSGASVLNGRVMALHSQLAALSALRTAQGHEDLVFTKERAEACSRAGTMDAMFDLVAPELTPAEGEHLRTSFAAKLLALAHFRPYEPDAGDCRFIRDAFRSPPPLPPANRRELRWLTTVTAVRLARKGAWNAAATLLPPRLYPEALARALLRRA